MVLRGLHRGRGTWVEGGSRTLTQRPTPASFVPLLRPKRQQPAAAGIPHDARRHMLVMECSTWHPQLVMAVAPAQPRPKPLAAPVVPRRPPPLEPLSVPCKARPRHRMHAAAAAPPLPTHLVLLRPGHLIFNVLDPAQGRGGMQAHIHPKAGAPDRRQREGLAVTSASLTSLGCPCWLLFELLLCPRLDPDLVQKDSGMSFFPDRATLAWLGWGYLAILVVALAITAASWLVVRLLIRGLPPVQKVDQALCHVHAVPCSDLTRHSCSGHGGLLSPLC